MGVCSCWGRLTVNLMCYVRRVCYRWSYVHAAAVWQRQLLSTWSLLSNERYMYLNTRRENLTFGTSCQTFTGNIYGICNWIAYAFVSQSSPWRILNMCQSQWSIGLRVRTHQQSRVESNPVQSDSQRRVRPSVAYLQWQPLRCIHTNRAESSPIQSSQTHKDAAGPLWLAYNGSRCGAYTPAESSRVESHESCRVKSLDAAYSIFVSLTLVIGRDGCYLEEEMDAEKLNLLAPDFFFFNFSTPCI